MKKIYTLITILCATLHSNAQQDSVAYWKERLLYIPEDSGKVTLLISLSDALLYNDVDASLGYAFSAKELSEKTGYLKGKATSLRLMGSCNVEMGNYPSAIKYYIDAAEVDEQTGDIFSLSTEYDGMSVVYSHMGHNDSSLYYLTKGWNILKGTGGSAAKLYIEDGLASTYFSMNKTDSARYYADSALALAKYLQIKNRETAALSILGKIAITEKDWESALSYYSDAFTISKENGDNYSMVRILNYLGDLYEDQSLYNTAGNYYRQAMELAGYRFPNLRYSSVSGLYRNYKWAGNNDSALHYLELTFNLESTIRSQDSLSAINNYISLQKQHQRELRFIKEESEKARVKNIQLSAIALFIPCFFTTVVYLGKRKVKPRLVEFLGVFSILMAFEFISFLAHPYFEEHFHNNQVMIFLCLVAIAATLSPLHHRIEHWIKYHICNRHI
ncbi:MAG TPA: tetratricopeptide repeat protein [Puia sp.]|nr:tetratricopeptide repeat protein [Puia sp.]